MYSGEATNRRVLLSNPGRNKIFFSSPNVLARSESHPACLSQNKFVGSVILTSNLHLVQRLRMDGAIHLLPPTPLWLAQGKILPSLTFTFTFPLLTTSLECDVYDVPEIAKEAIL